MVLNHVLDVQLFNGDHAVFVDDSTCCLVDEIMTTIANALVNTRQNFVGFAPLRASLLRLGLLASCFSKSLFVNAEELRIIDKSAIAESGERLKSEVNAYLKIGWRQRCHLVVAGKAHEPFTSLTANGAGLDLADKEPMENGLNLADLGQIDRTFVNCKAGLRVAERVVAVALKPWKT